MRMKASRGDSIRHSAIFNTGKVDGISGKCKQFAIAQGGIWFLRKYLHCTTGMAYVLNTIITDFIKYNCTVVIIGRFEDRRLDVF